MLQSFIFFFFFFNDTATTEIYTLSLHDALPISPVRWRPAGWDSAACAVRATGSPGNYPWPATRRRGRRGDRKSTRLNSSHLVISYAVFCLKKKKQQHNVAYLVIQQRVYLVAQIM